MRNYSIRQLADVLRAESFDDSKLREMRPGSDGRITVNLSDLTGQERGLARNALKEWSAITDLTFVEVSGDAQITYTNDGSRAHTVTRYSGDRILSAEVEITSDRVHKGDGIGSYAFRTYMHETAHALGLGHPQDYGKVKVFSDGAIGNDSWQLTVMSYFDQDENPQVNATKAYNLTPMAADYLAIRRAYGHDGVREGDTTYGVGSTAGGSLDQAARIGALAAFLVADTKGIDTVSFAGFRMAQVIDLRDSAFSNVMGGIGNMQIAPGTVIERAIGGRGNDMLTGNAGANTLEGGAGRDVMNGGEGNDTYIVEGPDRLIDSRGLDTVITAADYTLGAGIERLVLTGRAERGTGNSQANQITGNGGNNTLDGKGGSDRLIGGAGNDTYLWAKGDTIVEHRNGGIDTVKAGSAYTLGAGLEHLVLTGSAGSGTGNAADNRITGNAGANRLDGAGGRDTLIGGGGDDVYFATRDDRVVEKAGGGIDRIESAGTIGLAPGVENGKLTGTAAVSMTGNDSANRLDGNGAANRLAGRAGDDVLSGGAGSDTLDGGAGSDALTGGFGADRFVFSGGSDRVIDFIDDLDQIAIVRTAFDLAGLDTLADFARQSGRDVVLSFGSHRLIVEHTKLADLLDDVILI